VGEEELLAAGGAALDVDRGEDPLLGDLPVEHDLGVARSLELLEDHLVAAAARLGEGGGDDGEASAASLLRHAAGGAEEALRLLQGTAVDAAGERTPRTALGGVVGASEAGERVEHQNDVAAAFDLAAGHLEGHLGDRDVAVGGIVEGGGDD